MATTVKMVIQIRRDTAANWEQYKHIVPAAGEPCFVIDKNILKIGDGVTSFEKLEPINGVKFDLDADGQSLILEDNVLKLIGFDAAEVGAQPRKNANGVIEWVVPTYEARLDRLDLVSDILRDNIDALQSDLIGLKEIVTPSGEGVLPILTRVETLENEMGGIDAKIDAKIEAFAGVLTEDGKVNTLMELINYVDSHGKEAANLASNIQTLQQLVGNTSVNEQIIAAINESGHMTEKKANAVFERVKYEITNTPAGTLVDYRDKEIRVMCPVGTEFKKQNVGEGGNGSNYYMAFKAYAPEGAVSFKEGDQGVIEDKMFTFDDAFAGIDEFGRKYSVVWFALASYDGETDTWTYFGKNSSANKYLGWTYCVEWYDADGIVIGSDKIRINLSNESCHDAIEPFYIAGLNSIKEVAVNGTLLDVVDGRVNITIPEPALTVKGSDEIEVAEDGTLSIKVIKFNKIVQEEGEEIVLSGGGAAG